MSGREQTIVRMRFGLGTSDGEERTQKEVADMPWNLTVLYFQTGEKDYDNDFEREIVKYS